MARPDPRLFIIRWDLHPTLRITPPSAAILAGTIPVSPHGLRHTPAMPDYRRIWRPGGTYFFTVTLLERRDNDLLVRHIDSLRAAVRKVRLRYPFRIHAFVVLPDHLHCILEMPEGDADFATRWMRIKQEFSFAIPKTEWRSATRRKRQERGIW